MRTRGLKREKSGLSALGAEIQPPKTTDASNTMQTRVPNTGRMAVTALMPASPSEGGHRIGRAQRLLVDRERSAHQLRQMRSDRPADRPAVRPLAARSWWRIREFRERGICPRSRASCRRRCEGSSVRSPPSRIRHQALPQPTHR